MKTQEKKINTRLGQQLSLERSLNLLNEESRQLNKVQILKILREREEQTKNRLGLEKLAEKEKILLGMKQHSLKKLEDSRKELNELGVRLLEDINTQESLRSEIKVIEEQQKELDKLLSYHKKMDSKMKEELEAMCHELNSALRKVTAKESKIAEYRVQCISVPKMHKVSKHDVILNADDKSIHNNRKIKNTEELKEIGRKYLEHAKKANLDKPKLKAKVSEVFAKVIDYNPELQTLFMSKSQDFTSTHPLANSLPRLSRSNSQSLSQIK